MISMLASGTSGSGMNQARTVQRLVKHRAGRLRLWVQDIQPGSTCRMLA
jgi:hypothetical protein